MHIPRRTPPDDARAGAAPQGETPVLMISRITPRQVATRMARGDGVVFVDGRSDGTWIRSDRKLAGAHRATLASLVRDAASLPREGLVVVYGEDDRELDVPRLADALRAHGCRQVKVLAGGLAAWSALRLAVEPKGEEVAA
jgi:rhodanese-related sulfurtransferase